VVLSASLPFLKRNKIPCDFFNFSGKQTEHFFFLACDGEKFNTEPLVILIAENLEACNLKKARSF
jgi:hypothetical protein